MFFLFLLIFSPDFSFFIVFFRLFSPLFLFTIQNYNSGFIIAEDL